MTFSNLDPSDKSRVSDGGPLLSDNHGCRSEVHSLAVPLLPLGSHPPIGTPTIVALASRKALVEPISSRRNWTNLPEEMRARPQWLLAGPKPADKAPCYVGPLGQALNCGSNNKSRWMTFQAATEHALRLGLEVGYSTDASDPFACIDIDVKPTQGGPSEFQTEILRRFSSYIERSMNGHGYHIWLFGKSGPGVRRDQVEVYSQDHFIVCTGDVVNASPIVDHSDALTLLVNYMRSPAHAMPPKIVPTTATPEVDDAVVIERASKLLPNFFELWAGNFEGAHRSGSEADLALLTLLAREAASDDQCIRIFSNSGLGKRLKDGKVKWTRADYRESTMAKARAMANAINHGAEQARKLLATHAERLAASRARSQKDKIQLLTDFDLAQLPPPTWLVKRLIPAQGIGTVFGPSGSYKSFGVLDLLACIANGLPWFGFKVKQAPAVYLALEGKSGIPRRAEAWRVEHASDVNSTNVHFVLNQLNLRKREDRELLVSTLKDAGVAGGILCIDTLAQSGPGIDENSSEGMGEMISIFQELQSALLGVILIVHHTGKTEGRGPRGWSGLFAAMDFAIEFNPSSDGQRQGYFSVVKTKDDASGSKHLFKLNLHMLGTDDDGDRISSLAMSSLTSSTVTPAPNDPSTDALMVEACIREEVSAGGQPTGVTLESRLTANKVLSQARLRRAIQFLLDSKRVKRLHRSRNGNVWLAPADFSEQAGGSP